MLLDSGTNNPGQIVMNMSLSCGITFQLVSWEAGGDSVIWWWNFLMWFRNYSWIWDVSANPCRKSSHFNFFHLREPSQLQQIHSISNRLLEYSLRLRQHHALWQTCFLKQRQGHNCSKESWGKHIYRRHTASCFSSSRLQTNGYKLIINVIQTKECRQRLTFLFC